MKIIDDYLEHIQQSESFFPIDSFPQKREDKEEDDKDVLRVAYPNQ